MLPVLSHRSFQKLDVWHRSNPRDDACLFTPTLRQAFIGDRLPENPPGTEEEDSQLSIVLAVPSDIISLHGDKDGRYWPGEIVTPCGDDYHSRQTWQHDCTHR